MRGQERDLVQKVAMMKNKTNKKKYFSIYRDLQTEIRMAYSNNEDPKMSAMGKVVFQQLSFTW